MWTEWLCSNDLKQKENVNIVLWVVYYSMNFFNPILFAIYTSTFSKLCINVYSGM
jgi:hypothetical protein